MHVIIGALMVVGSFILAMDYMSMEFDGFLNVYSGILLVGVPIGLTIMTYRFATIWEAIRALVDSLVRNPARERERLGRALVEFGREVRRDKAASASNVIESEPDPMFRRLGRHVLQKTDIAEIEADALITGRREIARYEDGAKVFSTLGDFAPAMGMIGTVIGLIQLLANMRDFDKLGPGMAIALLTTFYGLILGHLVYLPLARIINDYASSRAQNLNLVTDAMMKIVRRRPMHEIQDVAETSETPRAKGAETVARRA